MAREMQDYDELEHAREDPAYPQHYRNFNAEEAYNGML